MKRQLCLLLIVCGLAPVATLSAQYPVGDRRLVIGANPLGVCALAFSPDGKTLASGHDFHGLMLWDAVSEKEIAALKTRTGWVQSVAFSPDGKTLAAGYEDKTVRLWDVHTRKNIATLNGHAGAVRVVAFSPDGKALASGSYDKTIKLWDVEGNKAINEIGNLPDFGQYTLAFSPDGKTLVWAAMDNSINACDAKTLKMIAVLKGHDDEVRCLLFSRDGRMLISASKAQIRLWDVKRGKSVTVLNRGAENLALSPDGALLATGGGYDFVLWDLATRRRLAEKHGGPALAFSPDGQKVRCFRVRGRARWPRRR